MTATRRQTLTMLGALIAAAGAGAPLHAQALGESEARDFVQQVADQITELIQSGRSAKEQAERFTEIFRRYAAYDQVSRFVMGRTWREMTESQQQRFREAFLGYVGRVYAGLLDDYHGQTIAITGVQDFGQKGIIVSTVARGGGLDESVLDWRVSDRGGDGPKVIDIIAEGVSLLQSQRQEFAAMLDQRGGDVDRFISDLAQGRIEAKPPTSEN